jgi:hypothetical protein
MAGWRYFDAPGNANANTMLLMTDGSVLVHTDGHRDRDWYRLTPDEKGRYHTGRWSGALPMAAGRLYFASARTWVDADLTDARLRSCARSAQRVPPAAPATGLPGAGTLAGMHRMSHAATAKR